MYNFDGTGGEYPQTALVRGSDGNFYGTAPFGGNSGRGTVFKITPAGGFTLLNSLDGPGSQSDTPFSSLIQASDGNFYGTTVSGGKGVNDGAGTVYKITPGRRPDHGLSVRRQRRSLSPGRRGPGQ